MSSDSALPLPQNPVIVSVLLLFLFSHSITESNLLVLTGWVWWSWRWSFSNGWIVSKTRHQEQNHSTQGSYFSSPSSSPCSCPSQKSLINLSYYYYFLNYWFYNCIILFLAHFSPTLLREKFFIFINLFQMNFHGVWHDNR